MCLLLRSQKIHLLGDFWDKSKGSPSSSNLPPSLKLSCDRDLKVLNASKSSEKSKGFFLVSCVTSRESFVGTNDPLQTHEKDGL